MVTSWLHQGTRDTQVIGVITYSSNRTCILLGTPIQIAKCTLFLYAENDVQITSLEILPSSCFIKCLYVVNDLHIERKIKLETPTVTIISDFFSITKLSS